MTVAPIKHSDGADCPRRYGCVDSRCTMEIYDWCTACKRPLRANQAHHFLDGRHRECMSYQERERFDASSVTLTENGITIVGER